MNAPKKIVASLEKISELSGKFISWLNFILILSLVYEVVCRFVFNRPTFWSYDISYMIGGTAFAIGAAWALKNQTHVRVDIFYTRLSIKNRALVDIICSLLLFFPLVFMTMHVAIKAAAFSWAMGERTISGYWNPPLYPLKTVIPITYALLLIQGLAEFIRNIFRLKGAEL
jgi:TRAP-type mannitol/chloroaromatic compound transport system permease small subunit